MNNESSIFALLSNVPNVAVPLIVGNTGISK